MILDEYKKKRRFNKTPEPSGKLSKSSKDLKFVVQKHDASHLHYDLRLEMGGVLKSWAIPKGPSLNSEDKRLAIMTEDHPYDYLTFEGVIPEGNYGAGTVMVWDWGTYHPRKEAEDDEKLLLEELREGRLTFVLNGKKLKGEFALARFKNQEKNWLLIKKKDEYAKDSNNFDERSVLTGREMEDIAQEVNFNPEDLEKFPKTQMPSKIKPMMATLIDKPFNNNEWIFEIKWDGYRTIAQIQKNDIELYSRNFISFNSRFSEIADTLKELNREAILDGEVVVLNESGKPDFQLLQDYFKTKKGTLVYYVFDLIYLDGHDLKTAPLIERKKLLVDILPNLSNIKFSDHIDSDGEKFFKLTSEQKLEGIMAKKKDSSYKPGIRSKNWLKIKAHLEQESIICGYTQPKGGRKYFGSLILGAYIGDELTYIGHCGGGFDEKKLKDLKEKFDSIKIKDSPFENPPKTNMPVTWLKPILICQVKFAEWTKDMIMRQPVFLGLREDKDPKEVRIEVPEPEPKSTAEKEKELTINARKLKLTNLNKIFWPEENYTKGDLINYYLNISDIILPYLIDRPESLHRYPDGIYGEEFYQKNMPPTLPKWIKTVKIRSHHDEKEVRYFLCQDKPSLIYLANFGCIDLNPWNSRLQALDYPDYMIIDLDPEEISFDYVIEAALGVKEVLDSINITSYPKTSGATGIHIYIPTGAKYTYDQVKNFAKIIVSLAHAKLPNRTSIERSPSKRQKRVYLDYLQNIRGQTLAAPYSIRPVPGATVSTPLDWKEVKSGLSPKLFTIETIPERIKKIGDIFKPTIEKGIDMSNILDKLK